MYGRRGWNGWNNKRQRKNFVSQEDSSDSSGNETATGPTPSANVESSELIDETQFKGKVHALLKKVSGHAKGTNEFAISGPLTQALNMLISIKDGGVMHFPMYDDETQKVIDAFERSPYGKGTETVVDPSVRNSWQLNPSGFNIMNPQWETYLKEVLIPKIGKEMGIAPTTFAVSLYKLLLYKTGSFFKVHRDSEKEERMFGTLVVQLPSKYTGGQLVVNHDGKTKTIDFSSSADTNNEFQMFYSAFYCDCEHEILPLTSGVRVCLIYNLSLTNTDLAIPVAPRVTEIEAQLGELLNDWEAHDGPAKIVYVLSHRYTENNFSLDSLKSSDKTIAKTLLNLSKENDFTVLMGIFEKESAGCSKANSDSETDFDSDDGDCYAEKTYTLKELKCLETNGENTFNLRSLSVEEEEEELIPENCFKNKSPYDQETEHTGNEGVKVTLFYRGAALVLFPNENIIEIFLNNNVLNLAEKIFLEEFEKFRAISKDAKAEPKLKKWANQIATNGKFGCLMNQVSTLSAIIYFNDLKLLQSFLDRHAPINEDTMPLIIGQCEKFGWTSLSPQLSKMFKTSEDSHSALKMLNLIVEGELEEDKRGVCCQLAQVVLDLEKNKSSLSYSYYRRPVKTPADMKKELEADQKFLFDFCQTAKKVDFNISEYLKTKSVSMVGPVLIKLSNPVDNTLDIYWTELGQHFLDKIEKLAAKSVIIPNWRFTNYASCGCQDCAAVNAFMISDRICEGFKLAQHRRRHIHEKLNSINNIRHETERVGSPFKLILTKLSHCQAKAADAEEQKIAKELLPKFRAMISPQNV